MGPRASKYLYIGCNKKLISGEAYSFKEFSKACRVSPQVIRHRFLNSKCKYLNDDLLVKPQQGSAKIQPKKIEVKLSISQTWLSMNLVAKT